MPFLTLEISYESGLSFNINIDLSGQIKLIPNEFGGEFEIKMSLIDDLLDKIFNLILTIDQEQ
jgi:hypothetical protein